MLCNEKHETYGVRIQGFAFCLLKRVDAEWTGNLDVDKWMMIIIN